MLCCKNDIILYMRIYCPASKKDRIQYAKNRKICVLYRHIRNLKAYFYVLSKITVSAIRILCKPQYGLYGFS